MKHLFLLLITLASTAAAELPFLRKQGTATQLMVDGQPYLMRAGELENSSGEPAYLGRHVRLEPGRFSIQRVRLYRCR